MRPITLLPPPPPYPTPPQPLNGQKRPQSMAVYWGRNLHLIGQMDRIRMTSLRLDFTPCDLVCIRRIRFVCCMSIRMRLERAVSEGTAGAAIYRRNRALNALRIHFQPIFLHFLNTKKIKPECSSSSSSSDID